MRTLPEDPAEGLDDFSPSFPFYDHCPPWCIHQDGHTDGDDPDPWHESRMYMIDHDIHADWHVQLRRRFLGRYVSRPTPTQLREGERVRVVVIGSMPDGKDNDDDTPLLELTPSQGRSFARIVEQLADVAELGDPARGTA